MKTLLVLAFLVMAGFGAYPTTARNTPATENQTGKSAPNQVPTFQEGDLMTFRHWVTNRLKYPTSLLKDKIEGKVVVSFMIDKEGNLVNIEIEESDHMLFSREVFRVLSMSPKWTPGTDTKGEPMNIAFSFPVLFRR